MLKSKTFRQYKNNADLLCKIQEKNRKFELKDFKNKKQQINCTVKMFCL